MSGVEVTDALRLVEIPVFAGGGTLFLGGVMAYMSALLTGRPYSIHPLVQVS